MEKCGRVPYDYSKCSRDCAPKAPRPRTEKKPTDFPIVARLLSRSDESSSRTVPIHIPRDSLDDDEASMCSEPCEESAFNEPPVLYAGEILDLPPRGSLFLGPLLCLVGGSHLFWLTSRRIESLREHSDVPDLIWHVSMRGAVLWRVRGERIKQP